MGVLNAKTHTSNVFDNKKIYTPAF